MAVNNGSSEKFIIRGDFSKFALYNQDGTKNYSTPLDVCLPAEFINAVDANNQALYALFNEVVTNLLDNIDLHSARLGHAYGSISSDELKRVEAKINLDSLTLDEYLDKARLLTRVIGIKWLDGITSVLNVSPKMAFEIITKI